MSTSPPPIPPILPKKSMFKNITSQFTNVGTKINTGLNTIQTVANTAKSIGTELTNIPYDLAYNLPKTAATTVFNDLRTSFKPSQNTFSLDIFEKRFKLFGKTLDKYMEEIAFDQNTKKSGVIDNDHIIVKNEILTVFHKSKLNPNQLAALLMTNNIYIENEKPGDWTRLQVQEVEEEMYNMRHEPGYIDKDKEDKYKDPIEYNRNPNEQSFQYTKKIKQNFD